MPQSFVFPRSSPELWFPMPFDPAKATAGSFNYRGIGRLRDDATIASARADLAHVLPGLLDEFPGGIPRAMWDQAHVRPIVTPLLESIVGDVSALLWILLGSVGIVLLIACANVANLFLVRGEARQLELAVRGALGSGIAGIVAQCLSESLVLAAAGGVIGVLFAIVGVSWAAGWADKLNVPRLEQVSIDGASADIRDRGVRGEHATGESDSAAARSSRADCDRAARIRTRLDSGCRSPAHAEAHSSWHRWRSHSCSSLARGCSGAALRDSGTSSPDSMAATSP